MASKAKERCRTCGGESFTTSHGLKVCDQCGRQEEHYVELLSQETIGEVDRSRLLKTHMQDPENDGTTAPPPEEKQLNNWTTYEAYNCCLYEWTQALIHLGASQNFESVMFKLWVLYLKRIGVAFLQKEKKYVQSSLVSTRDKQLLYEKAESVSSRSLNSYRVKKKKKEKPSKLDKLKDKIEWRKFKNEMKKKKDSSFMDTTLTSELSKSLNEFEASMLSDSSITGSSSHGGGPGKSTPSKTKKSSGRSGSSHMSSYESGSDSEREAPLGMRRKQIRHDKVVRNWMKRTSDIYASDSEDCLQEEQEVEKESEEDETNEEENAREIHNVEKTNNQESAEKTKRKSSSEQRQHASKRPRKVHNVKKPKYSHNTRKETKAAEKMTEYRRSRLPFILTFPRLLSLLYLAVLLAEEDILLSDIIRWCREGHIPYLSAPYLLRANMDVVSYDLHMLRNCKNLPNAHEVQLMTARLAVFLSVQYVPLPAMGGIVKKFVKLLNLPEEVSTAAQKLTTLVDNMCSGLCLPPVESMAMASIIMTLKMFCGLDGHTEVMLSRAADVIKTNLPSYTLMTPFSWQEWQTHVSQLVWVCCQVDPPTAFHWQSFDESCHLSPEVFAKYFWSEELWRTPRASCKKKAEMQSLVEDLLKQQGLTLEDMLMQPPPFEATCVPLQSTIDQLLQKDRVAESTEMQRYIKMAEELKKKSFVNHTLHWIDDIDYINAELYKCRIKTKLLVTTSKENDNPTQAGNSPYTVHSREDQIGNQNLQNAPESVTIPHPLTHYWKIDQKMKPLEKVLPHSLSSSFRWLVGVGSNVCETPIRQIFLLLCQLQKEIKAKARS